MRGYIVRAALAVSTFFPYNPADQAFWRFDIVTTLLISEDCHKLFVWWDNSSPIARYGTIGALQYPTLNPTELKPVSFSSQCGKLILMEVERVCERVLHGLDCVKEIIYESYDAVYWRFYISNKGY